MTPSTPSAHHVTPAIATLPDIMPDIVPDIVPGIMPGIMPDTLAGLRVEIDAIDDAMHDLLMRRADVVARVGLLRTVGKVAFRPGREADIIHRLLARHTGPLPRRTLARLWREIYAAFISIETPFAIAACDAGGNGDFAAAAREHFGALTRLRVYRSPAQAIADVSSGAATAAVLPMPVEEEAPQAAWWTALLHRDEPRIHVVARLPFWASPRAEGAVSVQALVVAAAAPDASRADRSLLGFELPPEFSRARLSSVMATARLVPNAILIRRTPHGPAAQCLVDVEGHVADGDPRLAVLAQAVVPPVVVLGGYAVPIAEDRP